LGGQVEQRGPQRLPGHPERAGQLLFDESLTRREVSAEDGLPERGEGVNARLLPGPRPVRRSCCHASPLPPLATECTQLPGYIVDNPLRAAARLGAPAEAGDRGVRWRAVPRAAAGKPRTPRRRVAGRRAAR